LTALKDWQFVIASAADHTDGLPNDLLMFSLRAAA